MAECERPFLGSVGTKPLVLSQTKSERFPPGAGARGHAAVLCKPYPAPPEKDLGGVTYTPLTLPLFRQCSACRAHGPWKGTCRSSRRG